MCPLLILLCKTLQITHEPRAYRMPRVLLAPRPQATSFKLVGTPTLPAAYATPEVVLSVTPPLFESLAGKVKGASYG